jgi:hypothetical protein
MAKILSAALPVAWITLRILIVVNWVVGAAILALLAYTFVNEAWTMRALGVAGLSNATAVMNGMRAVAALGLASIPLNFMMFRRLLAIVETVRRGDPVVADNAYRLQAIAWVLLALQVIGVAIWAIGKAVSSPHHPLHLNAGFSPIGWLAVFLTFVLARVFAEGTLMRDDLEGTV